MQFEYLVAPYVLIEHGARMDMQVTVEDGGREMKESVNWLGNQGWEFVGLVFQPHPDHDVQRDPVALFKRRKS